MWFLLVDPDIWSPNSPDLNPLDYFFRNEIEVQLKRKLYNNVQKLPQKLKESNKKMSSESIHNTIDCFRSRLYEAENNQEKLIINKY